MSVREGEWEQKVEEPKWKEPVTIFVNRNRKRSESGEERRWSYEKYFGWDSWTNQKQEVVGGVGYKKQTQSRARGRILEREDRFYNILASRSLEKACWKLVSRLFSFSVVESFILSSVIYISILDSKSI